MLPSIGTTQWGGRKVNNYDLNLFIVMKMYINY